MINNEIYQKIFDEISKYLPSEWSKIVAYFEYGEASYTFEFYVKVGEQFIKCYDLPQAVDDDLFASFKTIDKIIAPERGDNDWTSMTMIIDAEGNMHTDFDYTDLLEGSYQFKKEWKAKYLK